jgi:hypothetical protein
MSLAYVRIAFEKRALGGEKVPIRLKERLLMLQAKAQSESLFIFGEMRRTLSPCRLAVRSLSGRCSEGAGWVSGPNRTEQRIELALPYQARRAWTAPWLHRSWVRQVGRAHPEEL